MKRKYLQTVICILLFAYGTVHLCAQNFFFVRFTDKQNTPYSVSQPQDFLSERAINRRMQTDISIDSTDLPVNTVYLDSLRNCGANIVHTSRWLNGATIELSDTSTLNAIRQISFVHAVEQTKQTSSAQSAPHKIKQLENIDSLTYGNAENQIKMLHLDQLHTLGFRGQGICIAVLDNGFHNVGEMAAFDSIRSRILYTYNFVDKKTDVYDKGEHGTRVLSAIGGYVVGQYAGTAPEASFLLFHTEDDDTESPLEMDNWIAAVELADSLGTDIITSSLGYSVFDDSIFNFTYADMNGRTARNSYVATMAARKGILVVNSAGNEGNKTWQYITTPADADSIITVGSVTANGLYSSFSSIGPTADGRIKPTVCAQGTATSLISSDEIIGYGNGTSFSTPIMAGMAASLWSALPQLRNMELISRIIQSANQYTAPDMQIGYGIPDAWTAYTNTTENVSTTTTSTYTTHYFSDGRIRISNPENHVLQYDLYNTKGECLMSGTQCNSHIDIHLESFPQGIYILRFSDSRQTEILKVRK